MGLHSAKKGFKMWLYYSNINKVEIKLEFLLNDTLRPKSGMAGHGQPVLWSAQSAPLVGIG